MARGIVLAALAALLLVPCTAAAAPPDPFGHPCQDKAGVRFCPTAELSDRVPSWDGTPLDVDVTLPPTGDGPFPTLVMEHGYPGTKASFQSTTPDGDGGRTYHYNDVHFAQQGFAVLTLSARGFGRSCGVPASRTPGACDRGWTHIADHRFENRDTQHLLGLLVDQGVARADALAATGISGGAGRTIGLAFLRDRTRLPDGSFIPWRSPRGTPLAIRAAFPRWGWYDLTNALAPTGRQREDRVAPPGATALLVGVVKRAWIDLLYAGGNAAGYVAPPGADPQADLSAWRDLTRTEPYGDQARGITDVLTRYIGGGAGLTGDPAPMIVQNGWTDDIFPADEALRIYARTGADRGTTRLLLGDLGHNRGGNPAALDRVFNDRGAAFLRAMLSLGASTPAEVPAPRVLAAVSACPKGTAGPLLSADRFADLARGRVILRSVGPQRLNSSGGDATLAQQFATTTDPCLTVPARREANTATYEGTSRGFTLVGGAQVVARIRTRGRAGQIAARLWDVGEGQQRLVARAVYRLEDDQTERVRFSLHPNAYRFAKGRRYKLELLGRDAPYAQPPATRFRVTVSSLRLELPVRQRPSRRLGIVK